MSFSLAKICQQRCAKQRISIFLRCPQQGLYMWSYPPMLSQPTPHGGLVGLAGVPGFSIHDILYNRSLVMLVRLYEIRQFGMSMTTLGTNARRHLQPYSDATLQSYEALMRAMAGQMRMAVRADAFRFI